MPYADPEKKKEHHKKYMREVWYPKNKEKHIGYVTKLKNDIFDYVYQYKKGQKCVDCGFEGKDYPEVLEFDHLKDKEFEISMFHYHTNSMIKVKKEIQKCELVCANCHRIRTVRRRKKLMSA